MTTESKDRRPDESEDEKADRRYDELLQELRVAQTGVQFLFAFLLTLAFTQRFGQITEFQHRLYVGTLLATAVASALLIGPVPLHRILFRRGLKPRLVRGADLMARGGLVMLLLAHQRCRAADPRRRARRRAAVRAVRVSWCSGSSSSGTSCPLTARERAERDD